MDDLDMQTVEALDSFDISLVPDEGQGGFHVKNPPNQPFQRSTIHQDLRTINVKCTLLDVIHGNWSPAEECYASLIVLAFRFDPGQNGRRIKSAKITVVFYGLEEDDEHPEVAEISLNGSYSLLPSERTETITSGVDGTVGINALNSANISLNKSYEKVVSQQIPDATHVSGTTCMIGVDYDPANAAEWKLRENESLKSGVPGELRAGILLKRESSAQFKCTVRIESEVDVVSRMGRWLGGKPKDAPVLFNPSFEPTNRLMKYDIDSLGSFKLNLVEDVTLTTILDGAVKSSSR